MKCGSPSGHTIGRRMPNSWYRTACASISPLASEHAVSAALNGLSLSKLRPFGSTFLIFSDYARPAIRLSAIMELPVIYVFTHDAMGDGEDGPTHQPVEQLVSLRAILGLVLLRPGDANEVVEAYRYVLQLRHQPAVILLSRHPLQTFDRATYASPTAVA